MSEGALTDPSPRALQLLGLPGAEYPRRLAGEAAVLQEVRTTTEFRLLGPLEALRKGVPLELGGLKQRALLALLLLNANEVVSRDRLIEDLWGEHPPKDAPHTVQVFVSRLRKSLGAGVIETRAPGYVVRADTDELDLARFEGLQALGRGELERGWAVAAHRAFSEALSLFRGPPLADFSYEPWAEREVNRLEEARLSCLEERIAAELALGRHGTVLVELEHLVAENPFREQLRGYLMLALYRSGRQADALESYNAARADLDSELGIEPSVELKTLHRRILNQDATLHVEGLPQRPPTSLPSPPTPLLGREKELRELIEIVRGRDARLVTLTGPGGTGKTRLALEAAAQLTDDFEDGVFFVPLAAVREPRLVVPAIAQAVGLGDVGETAGESLAAYVAGRSILFLIDNFEQVVDAAVDLTPMLGAGDGLRLVVTSREPLRLAAERVFPVTSLAVPPADAVTDAAEFAVLPRHRALSGTRCVGGRNDDLLSRGGSRDRWDLLAARRSPARNRAGGRKDERLVTDSDSQPAAPEADAAHVGRSRRRRTTPDAARRDPMEPRAPLGRGKDDLRDDERLCRRRPAGGGRAGLRPDPWRGRQRARSPQLARGQEPSSPFRRSGRGAALLNARDDPGIRGRAPGGVRCGS